jgi:hypothetical protein
MKKSPIKSFLKLRIKPCCAVFEDQSIGPVLSEYLNREKINNFCNDFNNVSKCYINDLKLSVIFYFCLDNSFFFIIKGPRLSEIIKLILNINSLYKKTEDDFLYLTEFYDLIFFKYFFYFNNFKYNSFLLKKFLNNSLFSIKKLNIKNEYFE